MQSNTNALHNSKYQNHSIYAPIPCYILQYGASLLLLNSLQSSPLLPLLSSLLLRTIIIIIIDRVIIVITVIPSNNFAYDRNH